MQESCQCDCKLSWSGVDRSNPGKCGILNMAAGATLRTVYVYGTCVMRHGRKTRYFCLQVGLRVVRWVFLWRVCVVLRDFEASYRGDFVAAAAKYIG